MIEIGNMLWRIGEVLDFDEQLAWTRDAGFGGVGFHASAGVAGEWRGVEPSACGAAERRRLRQMISEFSFAEIHAPFRIELRHETLPADTAALKPILALAHDLEVAVVTVHARVSGASGEEDLAGWTGPMHELSEAAGLAQTRVALEIVTGFDAVIGWELPNVGVNLDVGHMYLPANRRALEELGGIGNLIRRVGGSLSHLHLHDVDGDTDHIEIGTGVVAFDEIAAALQDIGYPHGVTLELNPDRVTPEGIRRSAAYVSRAMGLTAGNGG